MFKFFSKSAPIKGHMASRSVSFLPTLQSGVTAADNNKKTTHMAEVVAKAIYKRHYNDAVVALKNGMLIPYNNINSNGHLVRYAYNETLKQLHFMQQSGHFVGVIGLQENDNILATASFMQKLREKTKMIARDSMNNLSDIDNLKKRNKAVYGESSGEELTLDVLTKRKLAQNPNMLFTDALKEIVSSCDRSSPEYNKKFGLEQFVIALLDDLFKPKPGRGNGPR